MINGGLVAVRRRLCVDLGVGELVHRVLDRSRGRRCFGALSNAVMLKTFTERGPGTFCLVPPSVFFQSAASIVACVSTPLKAAHVVTRSGASPSVALWSMLSAKPSACPRISLIFAIAVGVSSCEVRSVFACALINPFVISAWLLSWVFSSTVAFAYLRCSASRDAAS